LILSSLCFSILIFSSMFQNSISFFAGAILGGLGSAMLWTTHGSAVIRSMRFYEKYSGFNRSSSFGMGSGLSLGIIFAFRSAFSILLLYINSLSETQAFIQPSLFILGSMCLGASLILTCLPLYELESSFSVVQIFTDETMMDPSLNYIDFQLEEQLAYSEAGLRIPPDLWKNFIHLADPRIYHLVPAWIYNGCILAFVVSIMKKSNVPLQVALAFNLGSTLSSLLAARISDSIGRKTCLLIGGSFHLIAYISFSLFSRSALSILHVLITFFLGVGAGIFVSQLYAIMGKIYPSSSESSFSSISLCFSSC